MELSLVRVGRGGISLFVSNSSGRLEIEITFQGRIFPWDLLSARSFANLSPHIAEHAANLDALSFDIVKQGGGEPLFLESPSSAVLPGAVEKAIKVPTAALTAPRPRRLTVRELATNCFMNGLSRHESRIKRETLLRPETLSSTLSRSTVSKRRSRSERMSAVAGTSRFWPFTSNAWPE
jgi:hypothetical protein